MKKQIRTAVKVFTAVLALTVAVCVTSCANGSGSAEETWTPVTSLTGLEGTWKGSGQIEFAEVKGKCSITLQYPVTNPETNVSDSVLMQQTMMGATFDQYITKAEFEAGAAFDLFINDNKTKLKFVIVDDSVPVNGTIILIKQ